MIDLQHCSSKAGYDSEDSGTVQRTHAATVRQRQNLFLCSRAPTQPGYSCTDFQLLKVI